jgi:lysyl-tRNA synthetase class 2
LSEQEIIRRQKLEEIRNAGIDPYPAALYPVSHYSVDIKSSFSEKQRSNFQQFALLAG